MASSSSNLVLPLVRTPLRFKVHSALELSANAAATADQTAAHPQRKPSAIMQRVIAAGVVPQPDAAGAGQKRHATESTAAAPLAVKGRRTEAEERMERLRDQRIEAESLQAAQKSREEHLADFNRTLAKRSDFNELPKSALT